MSPAAPPAPAFSASAPPTFEPPALPLPLPLLPADAPPLPGLLSSLLPHATAAKAPSKQTAPIRPPEPIASPFLTCPHWAWGGTGTSRGSAIARRRSPDHGSPLLRQRR